MSSTFKRIFQFLKFCQTKVGTFVTHETQSTKVQEETIQRRKKKKYFYRQ